MKRSLLSELERRNVWRAAALYAAGSWLLVQIATQVFPFFDIPSWVVRWVIVAAILGFPIWIGLAWFYELTPEGLKRESQLDPAEDFTRRTRKGLDYWIMGILFAAVVLLLANAFVRHEGTDQRGREEVVPDHSVAVLPFENLSSDKEQEYFADGISEDLLDLLTNVPELWVAARTSSFSFRGQMLDVPEIGRRLHVANVLEGSVRRAGDEVRISARLVRATDGYEAWSQTWDRKLDDIFAIQSEIASDVARQLQVRLLGTAPHAYQTDARAYALFLQARELGRQLRPEAIAQSDSLLRLVLRADPRYAPAWTELARNFASAASIGVLPSEEALRQAHEAAEEALSIDSAYAPAYARLGWVATLQGNLAGAAAELEQALALSPADLDVLGRSAVLLTSLGRLPEAIAVGEFIVGRDPVNAAALNALGIAYLWAGRYNDAIRDFRAVLSLSPGFGSAHYESGVALIREGRAQAGLNEIQQETSDVWRLIGLPLAYHALGRRAESDSALSKLMDKYSKDAPSNIAYVYAFRGEADRALLWLDRAVQYGDPGLADLPAENLFDPIRSDPRWLPFLRQIGRTPEQLATISFRVRLPGDRESAILRRSRAAPHN